MYILVFIDLICTTQFTKLVSVSKQPVD